MPAANGDNGLITVSDDETQKNEEIIVDRPDLWQMDKCVVCQSKHFSETAKRRHIRTDVHKKRVMVHDFFLNEISSFKPSTTASSIGERISKCNDSFIGIECMHEFIFTGGGEPLWACSVCNCAGTIVDDVTIHLASNSHRMNYIEEHHPDRKPKGRTAKEIAVELGHATEAIVAMRTTASAPEVLELNVTPQEAATKLGLCMPVPEQCIEPDATVSKSASSIADQPASVGFKICGPPRGNDEGRLLQCESCWEVIRVASVKQIEKEWEQHLTINRHEQRARLRQSFSIDQSNNLNEPSQLEDALKSGSKNEWKFDILTSTWLFQGRIVGLEYLVERVERFDKLKRAKRDVVCLLCLQEMPITPATVVQTHVLSETHIIAYLHKELPTVADEILGASVSNRRELIGDFLIAHKFGKSKVRVCSGVVACTEDCIPHSKQAASELSLTPAVENDAAVQACEPRVTTLEDGEQAIWCEACWQVLFVPPMSRDVSARSCWQEHSHQQSHVDMFIKRKLFDFAEENFVYGKSCLTPPPVEENGHWKVIASTSKSEAYENQANVGLDFVIERHRADQSTDVVCLLCAEVMPCSDKVVHRHVQSERHVVQFLHSSNIPMIKLLNRQQSESARRKALLDYLKTSPNPGTFRIYHPRLAAALRQWGSIPACSLTAALMPEHERDVFLVVAQLVDDVCGPNDGPQMVPIKDALAEEGLKVLRIEDGDILLWCSACWQTIVAPAHHSPIDYIWSSHLRSAVHQKKKAQRELLQIDDRCFLKKQKSQFKVADVSMIAGSDKKRAWLRDSNRGEFDFVYRIVGLNHVIDRRSIHTANSEESDLFCVMCMQSMPRRTAELTSHVRSMEHVLQYLHKYNPLAIRQLGRHPLKDVELRSFITSAVRPLSDGQVSFVRVYDPVGVKSKQRSPSERPNESRRLSKEAHKEKRTEAPSKSSRASNGRDDRSSSKASSSKEKRRERSEERAKSSSNSSSSKATVKKVPQREISSKRTEPKAKKVNSSKTATTEWKAKMRLDVIKKLFCSINEEISHNQRPMALNMNISAMGGCLGANLVYEVICPDDINFKSYFCSICSAWETADQIVRHLLTDEHRLAFLNAFYKMHYKAVMNLASEAAKSGALKQYAYQIEQIEGKHEVTRRLRYHPDSLTLSEVWPNYHPPTERVKRHPHSRVAADPPPPGIEDNSSFALPVWPDISERRKDLPPPPGTDFNSSSFRRSLSASQPPVPGTDLVSEHPSAAVIYESRRSRGGRIRSRSPSPTAKRSRRSPSPKRSRRSPAEADRIAQSRRSSYNRSPTDNRRRRRHSRSRSRSRSPSRQMLRQSPEHRRHSRSRSPVDRYADMRPRLTTTATTNALSWDQKAAMFLEQIGDHRGANKLFTSKPPSGFVATQQPVDIARFAPVQEREQNRLSDSSLNTTSDELLAGFIDSFCATTAPQLPSQQSSQPSSEQLLSSLLNEKRVAATEQLLIKLLLEEREKQKQQENKQKLLIKAFSETMEKHVQQTKVVDYGHQSTVIDFDRRMEESVPIKSSTSNRLESLTAMLESKNSRRAVSPEASLVRDAELNSIRARAVAAVATNSARNAEATIALDAELEEREFAEAEKLARLVQSGAVSWSGLQQLMERVKKPEPRRPPPSEPVEHDRRRRTYDPFSDYDYIDQPVYKAPERPVERGYNRSYPLPMPAQPQRNADSTAVYPTTSGVNQKWSSSNQTATHSHDFCLTSPPPPLPPPPPPQQQSMPLKYISETVSRAVRSGSTATVFGAARPPSLMSVDVSKPIQPMEQQTSNGAWAKPPPIDQVKFFSRQ